MEILCITHTSSHYFVVNFCVLFYIKWLLSHYHTLFWGKQMDIQQMLFEFIGGLGIFLFGLNFMGDGLQKAAGDNLRKILNTFTSTPIRAIVAGAVVTVLIQSSSGTTVLTVGLVSAGFMSLKQAIGVIMGANIGTTITAFIIGLNIGAYALPIIGLGSLIIFFTKNKFAENMGKIIFGFGALFLGLNLMGDAMAPLELLPQFRQLMLQLSDNPILGVVAGTVSTLVVQSSSAMIGLVQEMYTHGSMELEAALPLLFGSNIGTTITAILASIGTSIVAKRTAASHVVFNVAGTVIVMLLFNPFLSLVTFFSSTLNLNPAMQLAFAHGIFNVINVLVQMWFIGQIAELVTIIVPGEIEVTGYDESRLDQTLVHASPLMALNQVKTEIVHMSEIVMDEVNAVFSYMEHRKEYDYEKATNLEETINDMDIKLTEYLMLISTEELAERNSQEHTSLVEVMKYLERIGDHGISILMNVKDGNELARQSLKVGEPVEYLYDEDVVGMFKLIQKNISEAVESFTSNDHDLANKVLDREQEINALEEELRHKYIGLLNKGIGRPSDGIMLVDIVSSLERMSDHTARIAKHTIGYRYPFQHEETALTKSAL